MTASNPEPQRRFTVTAGVSIGKSRLEADVAREIGRVGRGLEHVAEDGMSDGGGVHPGPIQRRAGRHHTEVDRGKVLEGATEGAEAGAHAGEEHHSGLAGRGA